MKCTRRILVCLLATGTLQAFARTAVRAEDLASLQVLTAGYPRAYFFRASESWAANERISFRRWEASFSRLMGIQGKVLEEEVPGRSRRNIDFFTRFKQNHPQQLVLLHYNGNARDPRYQTEAFFAGHWLYFNGTKILSHVPAESGETEIRVQDPALFRVKTGRYRDANEDVGLCVLDAEGKPDWHRSEQVELVSVDPRRRTLRVRRGCYGTKPRTFPAGAAYAAAHMSEGPWGRNSHLLWYYNYATCCPRDSQGRTCADVHCRDLAARFAARGELAAFDGLEFDVLHHRAGGWSAGRGADCDADGRPDDGILDGVNRYGAGVVEFCRQLRRRLGRQKIIQADGASLHNQRAFGILNGIESEGWPHLRDWEIRDWSGGLNRHCFWQQHAFPPAFNYVNHKFTAPGEKPGQRIRPHVPFAVHRLVMAAAMFTDSAVCYSFAPEGEEGELLGIWDELRKGTENRLGWLGLPSGPAVRLAAQQPDVLRARGTPPGKQLLRRLVGPDVKLEIHSDELQISTRNAEQKELRFRLRDVPCDGPDLFVLVTARGRPLPGYPAEVARVMWVGIAPPQGQLVRSELPPWGVGRRGEEETTSAGDSGAIVRWTPGKRLGGEAHDAYLVHPPYRGKTGYTFWHRDVSLPEAARIEFFTGMGEKSPQRSDGLVFRLLVAEIRHAEPAGYVQVFEHAQVAAEWVAHRLALSPWAGKKVRLKFVCDCGPGDDATTDHGHWGDVVVLGPGGRAAWTAPARFMTWLDDRHFTSGFYFAEVKSDNVDLEWTVEGSEPVWISSIRAYHRPDVIYRQFEHGLVLANPSPRPYVFDLEGMFPGREFRRLRGSPRQDPAANNGSPVAARLTLGPWEGLFLSER